MQTYFIYALKHPISNDIFYVGQTDKIDTRFKKHIWDAKNDMGNKTKADYIKAILDSGHTPLIEILETLVFEDKVNFGLINEREHHFMVLNIKTITTGLHKDFDGVKCLFCGNELPKPKGRRPKVYCSDKCRATHWQKNKPKKTGKYIPIEEYKATIAKLEQQIQEAKDNRNNPLINAARGRDESGVNEDEMKEKPITEVPEKWQIEFWENRVVQLEKELKNPEKNPQIGQRKWISVRQEQLKELKRKLELNRDLD